MDAENELQTAPEVQEQSAELVPTPSAEGAAGETADAQALPASQDAEKSGSADPGKVVPSGQSSSPTTERRSPSYYYQQRRIRKLEDEIREMKERQFQLMQPKQEQVKPTSEKPKELTPEQMQELYWQDPVKWALEREKQLEAKFQERLASFENKVPTLFQQQEQAKAVMAQEQEALDLLLPPDPNNKKESQEERMARQPERVEAIGKIIAEYGLEPLLSTAPMKAAKMVLKLLGDEVKKPVQNPAAPKKSQVAPVISGMPSGGIKKMDPKDLKTEIAKLDAEYERNPDLRYDEKWQERRKYLKSELSKVVKEAQGQ